MEMPFREVEKAAGEKGSVQRKSVWIRTGDTYSSEELHGKVEIEIAVRKSGKLGVINE